LGVVTALAVAAFGVALVTFKSVPLKECQIEAVEDGAYQVSFAEPPSVNLTSHELRVTRAGEPVHGAQVCLRADMGGAGKMSGMGVSDEAHEISGGRYELPVRFMMSGPWRANVIVKAPHSKAAVRVPITLDVQ